MLAVILIRFSPELHMIRPSTENDYWRLDRILQRKAVILCYLKPKAKLSGVF